MNSRQIRGDLRGVFGVTPGPVEAWLPVMLFAIVFGLVLIHERHAQEFSLSLAGAVLLDAFVVRSLLLPAVFELLGPATWKLPRPIE